MNEQREEKQVTQDRDAAAPAGRTVRDWGNQIKGAVIGGAIAFVLALVGREMGWLGGNLVSWTLWGAVIGGLVGGVEALDRAGRRLTRSDTTWLNVLIALIGMVLIFGFIIGLSFLFADLVGRMTGR